VQKLDRPFYFASRAIARLLVRIEGPPSGWERGPKNKIPVQLGFPVDDTKDEQGATVFLMPGTPPELGWLSGYQLSPRFNVCWTLAGLGTQNDEVFRRHAKF